MSNNTFTERRVMKLFLCAAIVLLLGCQQNPTSLVAKSSIEKTITTKFACPQSSTPPLKNTQKLKAMLLANGKIDASLSDEEIERAVKAYIRKKNAQYKSCKNKHKQ
jgi:bacillopeptidase F (M6 metalloprotease family)